MSFPLNFPKFPGVILWKCKKKSLLSAEIPQSLSKKLDSATFERNIPTFLCHDGELKDMPMLSSPAASGMKVKASVRIMLCSVWLDVSLLWLYQELDDVLTQCCRTFVRTCISVNIDFTVFKLAKTLIPVL